MRKNANKTNYHFRVDFDDGTFKRYMTIQDLIDEFKISNFTIFKMIREQCKTRKCPQIEKICRDYQPAFILVKNDN